MMNVTDMTQADQEALNRWDALLTMPTPGDVDDLTRQQDDERYRRPPPLDLSYPLGQKIEPPILTTGSLMLKKTDQ